MNILNDIKTMLCPIYSNSNTIELTVHTSCYWGLELTLCYYGKKDFFLSKKWPVGPGLRAKTATCLFVHVLQCVPPQRR